MPRPINRYSHPVQRTKTILGHSALSYLFIDQDYDFPVIFLHGIPSSAELWREIMVIMSKDRFAVYAPDLAGYGYTRLPQNGDYSLSGSAELISSWIETKFKNPVWLIGHDLGGAVSQIIAVNKPHLVNRLTLCNSPVDKSWPVLPVKLFRLTARLNLFTFIAKFGLIPNPYHSKQHPGSIGRKQFNRHLKSLDNRQTHNIINKLKDIKIPVQLIWAKNDLYQPWATAGSRLQKLIPQATVFRIEYSGHYLPLEKPAEFVNALIKWHDTL